MSDVFGVFRFLTIRSTKNRFLRQLRRLREPRYLVPTAVSVLWIGFWMSNVLRGGMRGRPSARFGAMGPEAIEAFAVVGGILLLLWTALLWILPSKGAVLEFTRAEIHYLFPAPVTRRQIVHYKLLRAQLGILFGALITSFFWGRGLLSSEGWGRLLGIWLLYATLHLHTLGAGFVRTDLIAQGVSGLRRRIVPLLALAAFVAIAVIGVLEGWPAIAAAARRLGENDDLWTRETMANFFGSIARVGTTGLLGVALWPFTVFPRLILAHGLGDFVRWLPPAFAILLINYLWVIRADTAFEEASVEAAQRRAERIAATKQNVRRGGVLLRNVREFPWRLSPHGRPGMALLWKNLVSLVRVTPVRALIGLAAFLFGMVGLVVGLNDAGAPFGLTAAFLAALLAVFTAMFGPLFVRNDLREDLLHIDAVKTFPLSGRTIVRGELLGPWVVLAGLELAALASAAIGLAWVGTSAVGALPFDNLPSVSWWFAGIIAAGLLLPALTGIQLALQNALVLMFPAWVALANSRARGFEASGQRMLTLVGSMLVLALCALPAAISGGVATWLLAGPIGAPSLVFGAAIAAGWLVAEVWWATRFLGRLLDRLDPSTAGIEGPEGG